MLTRKRLRKFMLWDLFGFDMLAGLGDLVCFALAEYCLSGNSLLVHRLDRLCHFGG